MSIQNKLANIKASKTQSDMVTAYGEFVAYYNKLAGDAAKRIKASSRRDWSTDRLLLAKIKNAPNLAQTMIYNAYGVDVLSMALAEYPFD